MYAKQWPPLIYSISYGILRKSPLTNNTEKLLSKELFSVHMNWKTLHLNLEGRDNVCFCL